MENKNQLENSVSKKWVIVGAVVILVLIVGSILFFSLRNGEVIESELAFEDDESGVRLLHVVTLVWEPYAYEENGGYKGLGYEVMDMVLNNLGVEYDFELLPWSRALKMAETGEADAVSLITHKEDREAYMDYTPEQYAYGLEGAIPEAYLVKVDYVFFLRSVLSPLEFDSLEQLARDA